MVDPNTADRINISGPLPWARNHDTAVLFGLGPSIMDFDMEGKFPHIRIAINEAVLWVPGAVGVSWDLPPVTRIGYARRMGFMPVFVKPRDIENEWVIKDANGDPFMLVEKNVYDDETGQAAWIHGEDKVDQNSGESEWIPYKGGTAFYTRQDAIGRGLRPGTAAVALGILYDHGVREVICVGMDSLFGRGHAYAPCILDLWERVGYAPIPTPPDKFDRTNGTLRKAAEGAGMTLVDAGG